MNAPVGCPEGGERVGGEIELAKGGEIEQLRWEMYELVGGEVEGCQVGEVGERDRQRAKVVVADLQEWEVNREASWH